MSALHPETVAERLRALGDACHCIFCRGSDAEIEAIIKAEQATIEEAAEAAERQGMTTIEKLVPMRDGKFNGFAPAYPKLIGYFEDYACGCVSKITKRKRDLIGYCDHMNGERRGVFPVLAWNAEQEANILADMAKEEAAKQ